MTTTAPPPAAAETVAVLGAGGTMGLPITRGLLRAGIPVRAWNRSQHKAEPLVPEGAYLAASPAEAACGAPIVITMLADEHAVMQAMQGPCGALSVMPGPGRPDGSRTGTSAGPLSVWIQMSTIGEEATRRCVQLASACGVGFIDARSWAPASREAGP
jgi:3-hydroxyisobutyrate dehydrogenase